MRGHAVAVGIAGRALVFRNISTYRQWVIMNHTELENAKNLHDKGLSMRQISKIIGFSKSTVFKYFKRYNFKNRTHAESQGNNKIMRKFGRDRTGYKHGLLTVISFYGFINGHNVWKCSCGCGKIKNIEAYKLRANGVKSCGCVTGQWKPTHNMSKSGAYKAWNGMIQRCDNKKSTNYKDYGGRGITHDESWSKFENFLNDMGDRPARRTIERIDNNSGYYKENCKWATMKEQQNNRRNNVRITISGKTMTLSLWSDFYDITPSKLLYKIKKGYIIIEKMVMWDKHTRRHYIKNYNQ